MDDDQLGLFDSHDDGGPPLGSIQHRFEKFHHDNPRVYELIVKFSRQVKDAGLNGYSINAVFERIRWFVFIDLKSREPFKLSNDFRSRYARLVMRQENDLKEFFETRELRSE